LRPIIRALIYVSWRRFGNQPPLRPYLSSFRHVLVDLSRIDDQELSGQVRLRAFLKALKYCRRRDLADHIHVVLSEAHALCDTDLFVILTYLDKGPVPINSTVMGETLELLLPDRKDRIMGWLIQPYYDKAVAEGEAKGEAKGEARGEARGEAKGQAKGEARVLTRFLEKRFGIVPNAIREQIYAADIITIEAWVERAFDAPDLQSVFESN
jgi:hypothetical protein